MTEWAVWVFRAVITALLGAVFAIGLANYERAAWLEGQLERHLAAHPDMRLSERMERQDRRYEILEARLRSMEIRLGTYESE